MTLGRDGTQLIKPVSDVDQSTENEINVTEIPLGPDTPLLPLSMLTSKHLSPLLPVHFHEVLYSYCFTLRLYNGDWRGDPVGAAAAALTMSPVLAGDREREPSAATVEVLNQCLERTCSPEFKHAGGINLGQILVNDVVHLHFLGRDALICLLCDLRRLVHAAEAILRSEKLSREKKLEMRRQLRRAEKKIYFFMCWVNDQQGREFWASMASQVQAEMLSFSKTDMPNQRKEPRRKPVIEEM